MEITKSQDFANPLQKQAYDLYQKTVELVHRQAILFIELGKTLKTIRDEKLYRQMGEGGFDTFTQFVNNPEIGLRQSTAYLYIRVYEYYVLELGMGEEDVVKIQITRLMRLLPVLKTKPKDEAKELIENIGQMTNHDADVEMKEKKLTVERPLLFHDKETGRWVFEYRPSQMRRIKNTMTNEVSEFDAVGVETKLVEGEQVK